MHSMHSRAMKRMEIKRNLSLIPEEKIDEIADFIIRGDLLWLRTERVTRRESERSIRRLVKRFFRTIATETIFRIVSEK